MLIESKKIVKNPEVSVVILTYNQEDYITQCVDAILSQKVDFSYEIIISDDCSQDNTQKICKDFQQKHPEKIRILLQEQNKGVAHNYGDAIAITRGKYIAEVAGDDFWIMDTKLQLQKDYLDTHLQCGLCYTNINSCDETGKIIQQRFLDTISLSKSFEDHLLAKGFIAPQTWMFRRDLIHRYDVKGAYTDESFGFALDIFATSQIDYIDVVTTNYRMMNGTLSRPKSIQNLYKQLLGVFRTQQYYCDKYNVDEKYRKRLYFKEYMFLLSFAIICEDNLFREEATSYCDALGLDITPYTRICEERKKIEVTLISIRNSYAYRIGSLFIKPLKKVLEILKIK